MTPSYIFGWTIMAGGTYALIRWFIMPDALDNASCDFSDADSYTAALRNALDEKPAANSAGGERRNIGQRASALSNDITHSHNRTRLVRTQDKLPST